MTDKTPIARASSLDPLYDASVPWRYIAPAGHTLEHCQRPDYWTNLTRELGQQRVFGRHAYNRIEIISEDGSWEAELRVMSVADGLVHTRLLREWRAAASTGRKPDHPNGYKIEHVPSNGWRVLDPRGNPIATKLMTEDEAVRAASAHSKKSAA